MHTLVVYLIALSIISCHQVFSMKEKITEKTNFKKSIHEREGNPRTLEIVPQNTTPPDFITVSEYDSTVLTITRGKGLQPCVVRWYNLVNTKLLGEISTYDYSAFSEGAISSNGPVIILRKNELLSKKETAKSKKIKKLYQETISKYIQEHTNNDNSPIIETLDFHPLLLCSLCKDVKEKNNDLFNTTKEIEEDLFCFSKNTQPLFTYSMNTDDLEVIDYSAELEDNFKSGDNQIAVDQSGEWKAIAIPNKKKSRIILCDKNNKVYATISEEKPEFLKVFISSCAKNLITGAYNNDRWNWNVYNISNKEQPEYVNKFSFNNFDCYFSKKNSIVCDYKQLYDGMTGKIIEGPELKENEEIIGLSENNYLLYNKEKITCCDKDKKKRMSLKLASHSEELRAVSINNDTEFAVYSRFPRKDKKHTVYIYKQ